MCRLIRGTRIYYDPGVYCSFGVAFPIGIWLRHDWDWRNHHVIAWGPGHARPGNWWTQPSRNRVAPRGVAVWHGPSRTVAGVGRSVDRGWSADTFRAARATPSSPAPMMANRGGVGERGSRPGTVPGFSTEFRGGATPQTAQRPGFANNGATQPSGQRSGMTMSIPPTVSRPAPEVRGQISGGGYGGSTSGASAFGGSESSAEARQSSVRGVESRSTMSAPAPAPAPRPSPPPQQSQPSQSSGSTRRK